MRINLFNRGRSSAAASSSGRSWKFGLVPDKCLIITWEILRLRDAESLRAYDFIESVLLCPFYHLICVSSQNEKPLRIPCLLNRSHDIAFYFFIFLLNNYN